MFLPKITFLAALMMSSLMAVQAQTASDIFLTSKTPITYIGLDFSRVQLVGASGFTDPIAIKTEYFGKWNQLVLDEFEKYDIKKAFTKETVNFDLTPVETVNENVDAAKIVTDKSATPLTKNDLEVIAGSYDFKGFKDKVALAFVVESLDKVTELATYHVLFVNTENNQIIFTDKVTGEPRGFGLRNYWAGAFYDALENVRTKKMKMWKKSVQ